MIEPSHPSLSIGRQCGLLGLNRPTYYYQPNRESEEDLQLMRLIDEQYLKTPFYGSRRMRAALERQKVYVNRKRVQRLMRRMGIKAVSPGPQTSRPCPGHKIFPYLLRGLPIVRPDQVWAADITYIPMHHGFMYLVAILDWFSRYVLSWRVPIRWTRTSV